MAAALGVSYRTSGNCRPRRGPGPGRQLRVRTIAVVGQSVEAGCMKMLHRPACAVQGHAWDPVEGDVFGATGRAGGVVAASPWTSSHARAGGFNPR